MMTRAEARLRMQEHGASYTFRDGEYRVTLNEWPAHLVSTEERAYYTDDLEDAVLTAGAMRGYAQACASLHAGDPRA